MSTHPRLAPAGLVVLSLVLAGCGVDSVPAIGEPANDLHGDYVSDGAPDPPFRDGSEPIRLTLRDGQISFTAACNHFSGRATWDGGVLSTSALGGTEMGCPGARQAQDDWMVDFFGSEPTIHRDGTDVRLRSDQDEVWFVPADEVASGEPGDEGDLIGTRWRLTGIGERDGDSVGMMVVPDDVSATIRFADDEVAFSDGCNSASGQAIVKGNTIRFGQLPTTLLPCRGAAAELADAVHGVVQGTVRWSITGDELRLITSDGRHELVYQR